MNPEKNKRKSTIIKEPESILDLPRYCSTITEKLQQGTVYYNKQSQGYRILILNNNEDCQIISILSDNLNLLPQKLRYHYPLSITSLDCNVQCMYEYNAYNNKNRYGIKSPTENKNFLTRRACFQVIDILQRGWIREHPDTYYTHPHKENPNENPHKETIEEWHFFSKRTDFLPYKEINLIRWLANRFGMRETLTCRYTKTNDGKRMVAIHIWVFKQAFEYFKELFCFELTEPERLTLCHIIAIDHSHDNSKRLNSDHCSTISAGHVASTSTMVVPT